MDVEVISEPGPAWEACERALDQRGTPLPLYHRAIWARAAREAGIRSSLFLVRDSGSCTGAFVAQTTGTRALPGHITVAIPRLGIGTGGLDRERLDAAIVALIDRARANRRTLRVVVDVFALDPVARDETSQLLARRGFNRVPAKRSYERTLLLDLRPSEEELFAALHTKARQGVRSVQKLPVRLRTADDTSLSERFEELNAATRARTGGENHRPDWAAFIEMSRGSPDRSRIVLLEKTDHAGRDAVIAFAWACVHGDVAEYKESASSRSERRIPTTYPLLWDLILWAKRSGARWFDLGGVTGGGPAGEDPLAGISEFKRRFTKNEVEVGEEWELYPHPRRAAVASVITRVTALARSLLHRRYLRRPARAG